MAGLAESDQAKCPGKAHGQSAFEPVASKFINPKRSYLSGKIKKSCEINQSCKI
jgi:hypothetical protein